MDHHLFMTSREVMIKFIQILRKIPFDFWIRPINLPFGSGFTTVYTLINLHHSIYSIYTHIYIYIYICNLYAYIYMYISIYLPIYLPIYLSISTISIYIYTIYVYIYIHTLTHTYMYNYLFILLGAYPISLSLRRGSTNGMPPLCQTASRCRGLEATKASSVAICFMGLVEGFLFRAKAHSLDGKNHGFL